MNRLSTLLFLLFGLLSASGVAQGQRPKTYREFFDRIQTRDYCLGKRFTYRHSSRSQQDLSIVGELNRSLYRESTRILEVGRQLPDSVVVPYRFTQIIEVSDEPGAKDRKIVSYWEVSDGQQTRLFSRFLVDGECPGHPEHLGFVFAGPRANFLSDALFGQLSLGGSALFGISGHAPSELPESACLDCTIEDFDHPDFGKTYIVGGSFGGSESYYELVLPEPEFLLVASGITKKGVKPEPDKFERSVDSIFEYEGFRFPKSGGSKFQPEWEPTTFEVISIEDFDLMPGEGVQWFPEWPTGTFVMDDTTGSTKRIPFEAREMAQYNRLIRKNCDTGVMPIGLASYGWAFWINSFLALGLLGYGFYFWKKRRA